jgi:hypothetical protein
MIFKRELILGNEDLRPFVLKPKARESLNNLFLLSPPKLRSAYICPPHLVSVEVAP